MRYIETALTWKDADTTVSFAMCIEMMLASLAPRDSGISNGGRGHMVIFDMVATFPTLVKSVIRWLASSAIRTAANAEAKFLMLTHALAHREGTPASVYESGVALWI